MTGVSLKPETGGFALLFDRLTDEQPFKMSEEAPLRTLDEEGLIHSIKRELARLLDTRASQTLDVWEAMEKTVSNYGVPDVAHLSPNSPVDMARLIRAVSAAIDAFEPRLTRVQLIPRKTRPPAFHFTLNAQVVLGSIVTPVSFPLSIQTT